MIEIFYYDRVGIIFIFNNESISFKFFFDKKSKPIIRVLFYRFPFVLKLSYVCLQKAFWYSIHNLVF